MADKTQLELETAINKAIQARAALLDHNKNQLIDQIAVAQELCRALECGELDGYNERIKETRQGLLEAADASRENASATNDMGASMKKNEKKMFSFKGAAVGAAVAIKNAFGMAVKVIKSIGGILVGLVKGGFNLVRNAFGAWNSMLGAMANKSREGADASIGFRNSLEDLKEQFGSLNDGVGKLIGETFDKFRASAGNLAGTGLRLSKVFGRGPDGLAALNAFLGEQFAGLGANLDRLGPQFAEAADEAFILNKALGFQGEDFERLGIIAGHSGETMKETMGRLSREIATVSDRFGVNSRVMSKNISIMMKSPAVFGTTTKEMIKTSVAAQKLGMSIEELSGPMSVFDDFESGAQAAADMAANFGLFVDAAAMMDMSPAEQAMELKEALRSAGLEYSDMSRQERKYLAESMGMTDDALAKMMDPSNTFDKKGMNAMETGVDAATRATMSQTKAVEKLTEAIKLMNETGQSINYDNGFFGAFKQGVADGLMNSKEMRKMMADVRKGFDAMYHAGREVGRELGRLFGPGGPLHFLMEYFEQLGAGAETMARRVKDAFKEFVDTLMGKGGRDPTMALKGLFEDLFGIMTGPSGTGKLFKGFMELFDLIGANIINALPMILEKLIGLFEALTRMLTGQGPKLGANLQKDAIAPMMQEAFANLQESGVLEDFGNAFMDLMRAFWDKFGGPIKDFLGYVIAGILTAAFLQALPMVIAGGILSGAMKGFGGKIAGMVGGGGGAAGAAGEMTNINLPKKGIIDQFGTLIKGFGKMSIPEILKAGAVIVVIGASLMVALKLLAIGIKDIASAGGSPTMVLAVAAVIGAMAMIMRAVSSLMDGGSSEGMSKAKGRGGFLSSSKSKMEWGKFSAGGMKKVAVGILAAIVVLAAVSKIVTMTVKAFANINVPDPVAFGLVVAASGKLTTDLLKTTAGVIAMGAILALLSMIPGGGIVVAAALAAASVVLYAVSELVLSIVRRFTTFNEGEAKSATEAAQAAAVLTEVIMTTLDGLQQILKMNARDPAAFRFALEQMAEMVDSIACVMMPAIIDAAAFITEDPEQLKMKMSILVDLMQAFSPIADLFAASIAIQDMKPHEASKMITLVGQGISGVLENMGGFVKSIISKIGNLSGEQIKAAEAAGPMISALASLLGAMPYDALKELTKGDFVQFTRVEEDNWIMPDTIVQDNKEVKTAGAKQAEFLAIMVDMIDAVAPALKRMAEKMMTIEFGGMSSAQVSKKMGAVAKIMEAVSKAGGVIQKFSDFKSDGLDKQAIKTLFTDIGFLFQDSASGNSLLTSLRPVVNDLAQFGSLRNVNAAPKGAEKMEKLTNQLPKLFRSVGGISRYSAMSFGDNVLAIVEGLEPLRDKISSKAMEPLIQTIKVFNELGKELSEAPNFFNISSTLRRVGEALKIEDEKIQVERGNVNVTVSLNVIMRAEDVAEALVEGDYVYGGSALNNNPIRPRTLLGQGLDAAGDFLLGG